MCCNNLFIAEFQNVLINVPRYFTGNNCKLINKTVIQLQDGYLIIIILL